MTDRAKATLRGVCLALLAFGLFSTHDALIKVLGGRYATFQIVFFSVMFSFPLLSLMLMRDTVKGTLIPVHPWWVALRTVAAMVTGTGAFYALSVLPLADVYALLFATPLLITALSVPLLGERVGAHRWAAVGLGLCGVLVVLRPGSSDFSTGHLAGLAAACSAALASTIVRRIGREERSAVLMLYPMMANFVLMGSLMPLVYIPLAPVDLGLIAVVSALGFTSGLCIIAAYRCADAAVVAPMQYSQILWAAGFGAYLFGDSIDRTTWIGVGIIIASGLYIVMRESIGGTSENRPVLQTRSRPETGTSARDGKVRAQVPQTP